MNKLESTKPRWYRSPKNGGFSWEIYNWRCFYISLDIGKLEFQINKWPPTNQKNEEDS